MRKTSSVIRDLFMFYYEGFRNISEWGKKVWLVIIIKLIIIFLVLKLFFFPDLLKRDFRNDSERSTFVRNQILNSK